MKRLTVLLVSTVAMIWSLSALAGGYAFVDMKKIFTEASQVKNINSSLQKQFASRKDAILKSSNTLQADIKKFERDKAVMNAKDGQVMAQKIEQQGAKLREEQMNFQQALYAAQNEAMKKFMDQVSGVVSKIAAKEGYDFVMPMNDLLYSNSKLNITPQVLSELK